MAHEKAMQGVKLSPQQQPPLSIATAADHPLRSVCNYCGDFVYSERCEDQLFDL